MVTKQEKIVANLSKYTYLSKFFGQAIKRRKEINGYTRGMLTANLLDIDSSKKDIERLEKVLQIGEDHCIDFEQIFKEMSIPNKDLAIDNEIVNTLAEVKAFEILYNHDFTNITKINRQKNKKTVDFTASRDKVNYAIEVTRIGLVQAERKKPVYMVKDKIPSHNIPGVRNLKGEFFIMSGVDNIPRTEEIISDTIQKKYNQIKEFCQFQGSLIKGILFISSGRDYFVMKKYAKTEFEMHPSAVNEAIKQVWYLLKEDTSVYKYLHHVIITLSKDVEKTIIFPNLEGVTN
jgi:hypothetical protein